MLPSRQQHFSRCVACKKYQLAHKVMPFPQHAETARELIASFTDGPTQFRKLWLLISLPGAHYICMDHVPKKTTSPGKNVKSWMNKRHRCVACKELQPYFKCVRFTESAVHEKEWIRRIAEEYGDLRCIFSRPGFHFLCSDHFPADALVWENGRCFRAAVGGHPTIKNPSLYALLFETMSAKYPVHSLPSITSPEVKEEESERKTSRASSEVIIKEETFEDYDQAGSSNYSNQSIEHCHNSHETGVEAIVKEEVDEETLRLSQQSNCQAPPHSEDHSQPFLDDVKKEEPDGHYGVVVY